MKSESMDRSRLSKRENHVLDLAIEGMTDYQIAHRLGIAPSTVSSYWVRIRGKLGHFSRTELVASALKTEAKRQIERLESMRKEQVGRAEMLGGRDPWLFAALEAIPEALLILDERGRILFANARFGELFGYPPEALKGEDISMIFAPSVWAEARIFWKEYFEAPYPAQIGLDRMLYGLTQSGAEIPILLLLDSRSCGDGFAISVIVRDFVEAVDLRRQTFSMR